MSGGDSFISVALFGIDGRFLLDKTFDSDHLKRATTWIRQLWRSPLSESTTTMGG